MKKLNLDEIIILNITIYLIFATTIKDFMPSDADYTEFSKLMSNYYGQAVVALIFAYMYTKFDFDYLNLKKRYFDRGLFLNLILTNILFFIIIKYPSDSIKQVAWLIETALLMAYTLGIPGLLGGFSFLMMISIAVKNIISPLFRNKNVRKHKIRLK
ncbi:hypothetical protein [Methanosarcina sp.]|uniref:hypothetical protein n=1 Tax=Methanosarcina sp. TaxID=2213 RepID=UPI003C70ACEF